MANDPCTIVGGGGSWDIPLCLPTNSSAGILQTGTGHAWSHPHSSQLLDHGWVEDGYYGGGQYAIDFDGATTQVDCGSAAALDDLPSGAVLTIDGWFLSENTGTTQVLVCKIDVGRTGGWEIYQTNAGVLRSRLVLATTNADAGAAAAFTQDKWHYFRAYYDDATKTARMSVDGVWGAADVGAGAYQADAAFNLIVGNIASFQDWDGRIGWLRLSNVDRGGGAAGTDFDPTGMRAFPGVDGNTIEQWSMADGSGVGAGAVAASVNAAHDGNLTVGTGGWEPQWDQEGTPPDFLQGIDYNGSTTVTTVTDYASIQDLADNAFTVRWWLRWDGAGTEAIVCKGDTGTNRGWVFYVDPSGGLCAIIDCATTDAYSRSGPDEFVADGKVHLVTMQFDDAGDRKIYLWVDGIPVASYLNQTAGVGAIGSDVGDDMYIGSRSNGIQDFDGWQGGWADISDVLRYTNGEAFVPDDPFNRPAADNNTVWYTDYPDGAGTTLTAYDRSSGAPVAQNGTISNGTWVNSLDMTILSPGSLVYGEQGYIVGVDGANEGILEIQESLSAGTDYVVRAVVTPGPGSTGEWFIRVRDETNGADEVDFDMPKHTGTHTGGAASATLVDSTARFTQMLVDATVWNITDGSSGTITAVSGDGTTITAALAGGGSNDWNNGEVYRITFAQTGSVGNVLDRYPWVEPFVFELPTIARDGAAADCTAITVKLMNADTVGMAMVHQFEVQENLADNGGIEHGANDATPTWIPTGWINRGLDAAESASSAGGGAVIHSGSDALQFNVGATTGEGTSVTVVSATGSFMTMGAWTYGDGTVSMTMGSLNNAEGVLQHDPALGTNTVTCPSAAVWLHTAAVFRDTAVGNPAVTIRALTGAVGNRYFDDAYYIALDPVTLTATPASEANSTESTGLRVDGYDNAPMAIPVGRIFATEGWVRVNVTPRHDVGDMRSFGHSTPQFFRLWFNVANYISVRISGVNTVQLIFDDGGGLHAGGWAAAGALVAGTTYLMEVQWDAAHMELRVDGVVRITIAQPVNFANIPNMWYPGTENNGLFQVDATFNSP